MTNTTKKSRSFLGALRRAKIDWNEIEDYLDTQEVTEPELILPPKDTITREKRLRRNAFEKTGRRLAKQLFQTYESTRRLVHARRLGKLGK